MSSLPVVNRPSRSAVTKGLLKVGHVWPGYAYFQQLAFVDEDLKVVPPTLGKPLSPQHSLEPTPFLGNTSQTVII